jgi:transmembrane sensor
MDEREFLKILKKYQSGEASQEEKELIDTWYENMGKQQAKWMSKDEAQEKEELYWRVIAEHTSRSSATRPALLWPIVGIAASISIVLAAFVYFTYLQRTPGEHTIAEERASLEWNETANETGFARRVTLPDETAVTLEPGSRIKVSRDFNITERDVRLEGKAFFEVTHNKQLPFIVHADRVMAKVLGTSFTVSAFKDKLDVRVAVQTGTVSVFTDSLSASIGKTEIILTPNQEIVYNKSAHRISRKIVDTPLPILPAEEVKHMHFENAPVKTVFDAIEKIYGIEIEYDAALLASCTLTTSVSDGDLYNRLTIITTAIGARYSLNENKIVIKGEGCR